MSDWLNEQERELPVSPSEENADQSIVKQPEVPSTPINPAPMTDAEHTDAPQAADTVKTEPFSAPSGSPSVSTDGWNAPAPQATPPYGSTYYSGHFSQQPGVSPTPPQRPVPPQGRYPYAQPSVPVPPHQPNEKRSGKGRGVKVLIVVLAVLCCASLITSGVLAVQMFALGSSQQTQISTDSPSDTDEKTPGSSVNENAPSLEINGVADADDGGLTTREIVANNLDSTVVLTMYQKQSMSYYGYNIGNSGDSLTRVGQASGIVMSEDGYIITNSHCVYDEDNSTEYARIDVTMYDGAQYQATIIGYDPTTDLAVIKVDAAGLKAAEFGDSSAVALGDRVITLGNSGGLQWSASQGILSGQARDVYEDTGYSIKCLQVDAIINPGSSGGPLLNVYGQVIGINSAKIVLTGYEGLGFSIPINEAKAIIDDLIKYGYATGRVSLGIAGRTVTSIGYEGFIIDSISNGSSLEGTTAKVGDIITHVDGVRVTDYATMRTELTKHGVGDNVTLTLLRLDNQSRTTESFDVTVKLGESTN